MRTIFITVVILMAPLFLLLGLLHLYRWNRKRKGFKSPLAGQLLRPPGESLRVQIEETNDALSEALFIVALMPSLISGVLFGSAFLSGRGLGTSSLVGGAITAGCFIAYYLQRIFRLIPKRRSLRSGLEGEQAVAEELNKLMFNGYHVLS